MTDQFANKMDTAIYQKPLRKLPVGIQSFENLRKGGYLYVDKTALLYRLVTTGKPYFLSRPRRFGKSLLLSTFEAYFQGKRELFEGLAIEQLEEEWAEHPVLHLSLNAEKYETYEALQEMLERQLSSWEKLYDTGGEGITYSGRFMEVIRQAAEKTGRNVVVLVDEYDKPLLETFHNEALQERYRSLLTAFYTVLKDADRWLKFVFITGVTKFAQVGVFSKLNQLEEISLDYDYATLCGMTREEIEHTFAPELEEMARTNNWNHKQLFDELTRMYDGYRFSTRKAADIYNPFSILNALKKCELGGYWFQSGIPTFIVAILKKTNFDLRKLDGIEVSGASLTDDRANVNNPVPMLYQSGYLTIKDYDKRFRLYTLSYPNEEVRYGFLNYAAPFYTPMPEDDSAFYIGKFVKELESGQPEAFLTRLRAFFAGIPYDLSDETERHYQTVFYLVFRLMGQFTEAEVRSAKGRADAVVKTPDYIYVFKFKLEGSAEDALAQIDNRGYLIPYTTDGHRLIKAGVNFSKKNRNIDRWLIEEV